jgi:hypothetical protein
MKRTIHALMLLLLSGSLYSDDQPLNSAVKSCKIRKSIQFAV